jgi:hypothetical protein
MARLLGLLLAIVAGMATALLLAANATAQDEEGRTFSCGSVIGAAAVDPPPAGACADVLTRNTELSAVTGLLCIAGGTIVAFGGRPGQPTNHPMARTASAGANPTR